MPETFQRRIDHGAEFGRAKWLFGTAPHANAKLGELLPHAAQRPFYWQQKVKLDRNAGGMQTSTLRFAGSLNHPPTDESMSQYPNLHYRIAFAGMPT